jgi:hypothetical protein
MIERHEYGQAMEALKTLYDTYTLFVIKNCEAMRNDIKMQVPKCFTISRGALEYFNHPTDEESRVLAKSLCNSVSFIMGEPHRAKGVALRFSFDTGDTIRIHHAFHERKNLTEEWLFQQSLVQSTEQEIDVGFWLYLKENEFKHNFTLRFNAYSLQGLLEILEYVQNSTAEFIGEVDARLAHRVRTENMQD